MTDYYLCPKCDNEVKVGTQHCPNCTRTKKPRKKTACESREQDNQLDGLDLPDEDFDYDEFIAKEFNSRAPHRQIGIAWYWWLTGFALITGFIVFAAFQLVG